MRAIQIGARAPAGATLAHKQGGSPALRALGPQQRATNVRRRQLDPCRASAQAEQLMSSAKAKYEGGDRMGALKLWDESLKQDPTQDQRVAALFNAACVHASFGDLELAQIPLKDAIFGGLDFQSAMSQPDGRYVKLKASAQVLIQLRRFNDQVLKAKAAAAAPPPPPFASSSRAGSSSSSSSKSKGGKGLLDSDMSDVLSTDAEGIDASIGGIIKRVLVLLLALSALGGGLFYLGLKYLFIDSPY